MIDDHQDRFEVEPICRVLNEHGVEIAPSACQTWPSWAASARTPRDAEVLEHIKRIFWDPQEGRGISGVCKMWCVLARELLADAVHALRVGVSMVVTCRDLRHDLTGAARLIPLWSTNDLVMTCFVEAIGQPLGCRVVSNAAV